MIKYIQIIGERHTGTKGLKNILRNILTDIQVSDGEKHGFINEYKLKHFLDTSLASIKKMKKNLKNDNLNYDVFNNLIKYKDEMLIIIINRYIYDWLIAMKKDPHHCRNKRKIITEINLSEFIHSKGDNPRDEINGKEKVNNIENVIDLGTKKYINGLHYFSKLFNNVNIIRYEDLLVNLNNFLKLLISEYDLNYNNNNKVNVNKSKIKNSLFFNKKQKNKIFTKSDIKFINSYSDNDIEKLWNYKEK